MFTTLLQTKFYIPPPQPNSIQRPRLTQLINKSLDRKLILISAPAGFGKTTLLSEWILSSQQRVSWISLEDADNDPTRFWNYFIGALQILQEGLVKDARVFLQKGDSQNVMAQLESFITILINEISEYPEEFTIILDDYHQINNKAIHEGINFLIDHLPPRMHLILACRADPPLPLARLRARGQMVELRAENLRFTSDEAMVFLNQIMSLGLSADQIAALETRTEGWIAGIQLAAISMQRSEDTTRFIETFTGSHRFIMDYLVDEVLNYQPEDVQAFLLDTSILERFTGSLCDSLTGKTDGQEMLRQLEQSNLFIIPLDNERRWYRYHHLFADLLHSRLQESKPDQVALLHQRACGWFEREGLLPEAIQHAIKMRDYERAAQLIERTVEVNRQKGEIATLTGWVDALPDGTRRSHPSLCLAYARALVDTSQNISIEALVDEAETALQTEQFSTSPGSASLRGQIAALRAHLAMIRNHFEETIELSRFALDLLGKEEARWRSFVGLILAGAYRFTNDWAAASQAYLEASELSQSAGDGVNTLAALSMRGEVLEAQGHLHQSTEQFERVLRLAQELVIPTAPVTGYALSGLGRVWFEWNDLQASSTYVHEGIERSIKGDNKDILLRGYLMLARLRQAQADLEGTQEALDNAELAAIQMGGPTIKDWVNAFRVQAWLAQGEVEPAIDWASKYSGEVADKAFPTIAITLARVRLAQGRSEEALGLLNHALQSAYAVGRLGNAIQILTVKALIHRVLGDLENTFITLSRALTLAEPEGYVRTFLDEGESMRSLLSDFKTTIESRLPGTGPDNPKTLFDYTQKLLAGFAISSIHQTSKPLSDHPQLSIPEPLSERELEVLRLMEAGLSNREIADKDIVSINTVKTQVKSIYGKLGVHNREDAILTARESGLL